MSNQIYTIDQIQAILRRLFQSYGIKRAVLFGSYGKGTATNQSDIDLLVESNLKGLKFVGFMEELRKATDKEVDVFDVTHIDKNSKIEEEIKRTGVTIYEE